MKIFKLILIFVVIGIVQTLIVNYFNMHSGLEHMENRGIFGYIFESLFYSIFWVIIYGFINSTNRRFN